MNARYCERDTGRNSKDNLISETNSTFGLYTWIQCKVKICCSWRLQNTVNRVRLVRKEDHFHTTFIH